MYIYIYMYIYICIYIYMYMYIYIVEYMYRVLKMFPDPEYLHSMVQGWSSLTMAFTGKFVYTAIHFILL